MAKYIIDIPEEITKGGFQVRVEKPGDRYGKFIGYALKPVPFDKQDDSLWDKGYSAGLMDGRTLAMSIHKLQQKL